MKTLLPGFVAGAFTGSALAHHSVLHYDGDEFISH